MRKRPPRAPWHCLALCGWLLVGALAARAQTDAPPPSSAASKKTVRITFLPPPIEGRLSLGIYNKAGKLVRSLHREAREKEFVVGLNGYTTQWDGRDDAGQTVPNGKYAVRGFAMAELEVEGIAFRGNDFSLDFETPRVAKLLSIGAIAGSDDWLLHASQPDGSPVDLRLSSEGKARPAAPEEAPLLLKEAPPSLPGVENALASCPGRNGSFWIVDKTAAEGVVIKEFSEAHEPLRRWTIAPGDPEPFEIALAGETLILLERSARLERVRAVMAEKTVFTKTIVLSNTFADGAEKLGRSKPFAVEEKIRLRLAPNPLFKDASQDLDVRLGFDANGSFFQTPDGLLLRRITGTPALKWAVMGRDGGRTVTLFQSDGAVIEEFKARRLANTMAFDAGSYDWPPARDEKSPK